MDLFFFSSGPKQNQLSLFAAVLPFFPDDERMTTTAATVTRF